MRRHITWHSRCAIHHSSDRHVEKMNTILETKSGQPTPSLYSAKSMTKPVHFYCQAPAAQCVCLIGDFNGWDPQSHPMRRRPDGWWDIELPFPHGHHAYLFLVDGVLKLDPRSSGTVAVQHFAKASVITVS